MEHISKVLPAVMDRIMSAYVERKEKESKKQEATNG